MTETGAVVFMYNPGNAYVIKISTVTLADNSWHHIAGVYTGSKGSIYIDGNKVPLSRDDFDPGGTLNSVDEDLLIGCGNYPNENLSDFFDGTIDDVRIYDRALSAEEIQAAMHTRPDIDDPTLVGYWDFDEGEGQVQIADHALFRVAVEHDQIQLLVDARVQLPA